MMHDEAVKYLLAASKLHKAHMSGDEPTSEKSQMRLQNYIESALSALTSRNKMSDKKPRTFFG